MKTRREFLGGLAGAGAAGLALAALRDDALATIHRARRRCGDLDPDEVARDERYWRDIQSAFTVDRNYVNLNNGGVCPSPRVVQQAMLRYLDYSQAAPAYTMWRHLEPNREVVRTRLARAFGCDREELALTRNASEALETVILGLPLERGDEVIATTHNYPRMLTAWRQRARREGIVLRTFEVPTNPASLHELVEAFKRHITPRTRVIEICHVTNRNGQIYPVREVCRMARERGITVVVDGAHAFAHFPFRRADLECDFYGTSLHKWLLAPHGTGFLYVRKERIKEVWPLMAAEEKNEENIRKFEEIGTHPAANHLAIGEALTFHEGIGPANKAARLRYLSRYWIERLQRHPRVRLLTNDDPQQSCGLRMLSVEGLEPGKLSGHLIRKHGIITCAIGDAGLSGLRITPNVYTTLPDLDRFVEAVEEVLKNGLPA